MPRLYLSYIPIAISALVLASLEALLIYAKSIYFAIPSVLFLLILALFVLTPKGDRESWYNFSIFPTLLLLGCLAYTSIAANVYLIQLVYFLTAFLVYYYYRTIYSFFHDSDSYHPFTFENISNYGSFIVFFLFSSSVYGLQSFLNISFWILMLFIMLFSFLIMYYFFWSHKIGLRENALYNLINVLVITELAWSISYLPIKYSIAGITLSIFYYMIIGLTRYQLSNKLDGSIIKLYVGFGAFCIIVILLTARWI